MPFFSPYLSFVAVFVIAFLESSDLYAMEKDPRSAPAVTGRIQKQEDSKPHDLPPPVFSYCTAVCTTDGMGDFIHGERFLSLLAHAADSRTFSRVYIKGMKGNNTPIDEDYPPRGLRIDPARRSNIEIVVSYRKYDPRNSTLYFGEYGNSQDLIREGPRSMICVPLGLSTGLGYMKPPPCEIMPDMPKEKLFSVLNKKWQELIWPHGYNPNNSLVLGYYSPNKSFPPENLRAFVESPFNRGKEVVFFVKGDDKPIEALQSVLQGTASRVVTTKEHVPDDDWHRLSQMAVASVATGDSSMSDTFFFRSLLFSNDHKPNEGLHLTLTAMHWQAPAQVDKERLITYLKLLRTKEKPQTRFIETIDQKFMEDWQLFAAYIEERYTLTPSKLEEALEIAEHIYYAQLTQGTEKHIEAYRRLVGVLMRAKYLNPETVGCFVTNYIKRENASSFPELENLMAPYTENNKQTFELAWELNNQ